MSKPLTTKELVKLQDAWLAGWHTNGHREYQGGTAECWFNIVVNFLAQRGDEIVPAGVRERELRAIELGLSQEYMAALADTVYAKGAKTEYDKAVLILTASPEERSQALDRILGGSR